MKSVHERLRSDQPVGTLLSGGLDSSIITALAAKEIPGIPVFTAGFTEMEFDESAAARTLADHVGAVLHHHVLTAEEGLRTLPNVIASMDEPSGDQALLPLYLLARDAKASVRVLLTGDGADELFGGYDYYAHATQSKSLRQVLFGEYDRTRSGFPLVSLPAQRRSLLSFPEPHGWQTNLVYLLSDPLRIAQEEDIRTWLPDDLLMKTDKMTMASSIEARCPFLSPTLAAYALGLPAHYKRSGALSKIVLREAFPDLLPPEIHARPKRSFAVPISAWLRGPWRALAEDVFRLEQDDGCIPHACVALLEKHAKGEDSARLLYAILAYRMWFYEHARYSQSPPVVSALLSCCSKP
jgi:asparagine synthase (glutamine-hydrolysing)